MREVEAQGRCIISVVSNLHQERLSLSAITKAQYLRVEVEVTSKNGSEQTARYDEPATIFLKVKSAGAGDFRRIERLSQLMDHRVGHIQFGAPHMHCIVFKC